MTEAQRNYLADLAGRKGVRLQHTDDMSVSSASEKIEELKAMPDKIFAPLSEKEAARIDDLVGKTLVEMNKWGFE
jgi:hypothetical protein